MTKKELQRRRKISLALKRYHKNKEIQLLDKLLAKQLENKKIERAIPLSSNGWIKNKLRKKVKAFPSKENRATFFYATKREYNLKQPIKVVSNIGIKKVKQITSKLKNTMVRDIIKNNKKNKPINVGYKIRMEFKSKDGSESKVIESTSYRESFTPKTKKDTGIGIDILKNQMIEAFKEYITTSGFSELTLMGLESEIQE